MVVERVKRKLRELRGQEWHMDSRRMVIKEELRSFRRTFQDNFITLIISGFGVVAALSWNDAIKQWVLDIFPTGGPLLSKVYSAIVITLISIIVTYLFSKLKSK